MDTALTVMKRAAKAILKDDLKALRAKHKEQLANTNRAAVSLLQTLLAEARDQVRALRREADRQAAVVLTMQARDRRLMCWIDRNRGAGDTALKCVGEYLMHPTGIDHNCANTAGVSSFARWGLENP